MLIGMKKPHGDQQIVHSKTQHILLKISITNHPDYIAILIVKLIVFYYFLSHK